MTQPVHPTPEEEPAVEDDPPSNSPGDGDDTTFFDAEEPLLSLDLPLIFINSLPEENSVFVTIVTFYSGNFSCIGQKVHNVTNYFKIILRTLVYK